MPKQSSESINLTLVSSGFVPEDSFSARADTNATVNDLLRALADRIRLPAGVSGTLIRKSTGERLQGDQTLASAGIKDDEELIADFEKVAGREYPWGDSFAKQEVNLESVDVELLSPNFLRVHISLPSLLTIDDFGCVVDVLKAVEFVHLVLEILSSEDSETIRNFVTFLQVHADANAVSNSLLKRFSHVTNTQIEPFRLVSVHYGSNASFDFLGAGKILELMRDIIKDWAWRGEHEREIARLERREKQAEIGKARLETEKAAIEIAAGKEELEKARLGKEEKLLAIATRELELIEKVITMGSLIFSDKLKISHRETLAYII